MLSWHLAENFGVLVTEVLPVTCLFQGQGLEEWSLVPTVIYSSFFQNDEDDESPRFLGDRRTWKICEDCDSRTSET